MPRLTSIASCLLLICACSSDSKEDAEDLPVAQTWGAAGSSGDVTPIGTANAPHAGLDMGSPDPHAGLGIDLGSPDPHAGLGIDMGSNDPHAGLNEGSQEGMGSVAGLGFAAPDPSRKVDPSLYLAGELTVSDEMRNRIVEGSVLFLSVRPVNKVTGESLGSPLAVEIMPLASFPIPFHLSAAQSMVAGTNFFGDVVVYARLDGDGEATTSFSGDIEGSIRAAIPADGLKVVLDTLVP